MKVRLVKLNSYIRLYFNYEERYALAAVMAQLAGQKCDYEVVPQTKSFQLMLSFKNAAGQFDKIKKILLEFTYPLSDENTNQDSFDFLSSPLREEGEKAVYEKWVSFSEQIHYRSIVNVLSQNDFIGLNLRREVIGEKIYWKPEIEIEEVLGNYNYPSPVTQKQNLSRLPFSRQSSIAEENLLLPKEQDLSLLSCCRLC